MKKEIAFATVLVAAAGLLAACSDSLVEGGRPLTVSISADKSVAAVGDSIVYRVEATGNNLVGLVVDFGDGVADSTSASGAVSAGVVRSHIYAEAGDYWAKATAVDVQGVTVELSDSVAVQIVEGGG